MKPREWWIDERDKRSGSDSYLAWVFIPEYDRDVYAHVIEKSAYDLEHSRLNYVMECLEDWIEEIECRGDEDCDHCVVKLMIQDQKEHVGGS